RLYPGISNVANKMIHINFIKNLFPFMNVPPKDIYQLAEYIQTVKFDANAIIFHEGDTGDKIYLLKSGQVQIQKLDSSGNVNVLANLTYPDIFGETALLSGLPRNATAIAIKECELLFIDSHNLNKMMHLHPSLKKKLLEILQLRNIPKRITSTTSLLVKQKGEQFL